MPYRNDPRSWDLAECRQQVLHALGPFKVWRREWHHGTRVVIDMQAADRELCETATKEEIEAFLNYCWGDWRPAD